MANIAIPSSSLDVSNSRYVKGGQTEETTNRLGWWERTIFTFRDDDQIVPITSKYVNRADLIAYDYLGSESYEWLVLQYNTILKPARELVIGVNIRLPALSRLP